MKCTTKHCRNEARKGRTICRKCESRKYRQKHPLKASFHLHKSNAKRRGITWNLTFEQFAAFATECELLTKAGRSKNGYHIDRIDESKGYTIDNIQPLTNSDNVKKSHEYRRIKKFLTGDLFAGFKYFNRMIKPKSLEIDDDLPF